VDEYMQAAVRNAHRSGTILIARDGVPLVSRAYGMSNYELRTPNTTATVYETRSVQVRPSRAATVGDCLAAATVAATIDNPTTVITTRWREAERDGLRIIARDGSRRTTPWTAPAVRDTPGTFP
jgi:hypothetical protein